MKIDILGLKINAETRGEILEKIESGLAQNRQLFLVTPYSESVVAAQKDREYRHVLNSADLALPDGIGLLWAAKFLSMPGKNLFAGLYNLVLSLTAVIFNRKYISSPIPEQISGSKFIMDLTGLAEQKKYTVFLLGGFAQIPQTVAKKLQKKFPNLKIAGTYPGSPDEPGLIQKINDADPDFLFVAFGPKKQERWICENRAKLRAKLLIGLGGTFDYLAGNRPTAPNFWANRGLEWLWRLLTQPWRLGRITRGVFGLIYYCFLFKANQV